MRSVESYYHGFGAFPQRFTYIPVPFTGRWILIIDGHPMGLVGEVPELLREVCR